MAWIFSAALTTWAVRGQLELSPEALVPVSIATAAGVIVLFALVGPYLLWRDSVVPLGSRKWFGPDSVVFSHTHGSLVRLRDAAIAAFTETHKACNYEATNFNEETRTDFHLEQLLRGGRNSDYSIFGRVEPAKDWRQIDELSFLAVGNLTKDHLHIGTANVRHWSDISISPRDLKKHIRRLQKEVM